MLLASAMVSYWCPLKISCRLLVYFARFNILKKSWLDTMTDFNEICYRAVTEFLTLENIQPQQAQLLFTVNMRHHMPRQALGS